MQKIPRPTSSEIAHFRLSIPKPCHESWNSMTPVDDGRHCTSCCKTVVDFSGMTDDEIKAYFLNTMNRSVCGRFRIDQLGEKQKIQPIHISNHLKKFWRKRPWGMIPVLFTSLLMCIAGCKSTYQTGEVDLNSAAPSVGDTTCHPQKSLDQTPPQRMLMGKVAIPK